MIEWLVSAVQFAVFSAIGGTVFFGLLGGVWRQTAVKSGWTELARWYPRNGPAADARRRFRTVYMKHRTVFKNSYATVTIGVAPGTLHLEQWPPPFNTFHPPLAIPLEDIDVSATRIGLARVLDLTVRAAPEVSIQIPWRQIRWIDDHTGASWAAVMDGDSAAIGHPGRPDVAAIPSSASSPTEADRFHRAVEAKLRGARGDTSVLSKAELRYVRAYEFDAAIRSGGLPAYLWIADTPEQWIEAFDALQAVGASGYASVWERFLRVDGLRIAEILADDEADHDQLSLSEPWDLLLDTAAGGAGEPMDTLLARYVESNREVL